MGRRKESKEKKDKSISTKRRKRKGNTVEEGKTEEGKKRALEERRWKVNNYKWRCK